jgi:membrane-associated phospholipid phosphatase
LATLATRFRIDRMARVWSWLRRRDGLQQILIVVGGFEVYEGLRHVMTPNWPAAFDNAARIEQLERWGHFAWEQSLQRVFLGVPDLVQAMNFFYFVGHFVLTGVFFAWLYFHSREGFRSVRNAFLVATAISLFIHWQLPTAPPRLADVGLIDTLRAFSGIDIGSPHSSPFSNPVAAVPSLHAGFALGVAYGVVKFTRAAWIKALGVLYPVSVVLTIVVTGNHFILDAVAGMLVMALGFMGASRLQPRKDRAILATATRGGAVR